MKPFAPGQRWTYRTRPGEDTSTLLVLGCDLRRAPEGESGADGSRVVSVRLDRLRMIGPEGAGSWISELAHTPVAEANVRDSVLDLLEEGVPLPADLSGYHGWQLDYEKGEAGFFTVPIAEILDLLEGLMGPPPGPAHPVFQKSNGRARLLGPWEDEGERSAPLGRGQA
ncbi:hypothetical protein SAMN04488058_101437 [Deinococcus reticulitermitis]|uniref:Uncharacterized protein n=1 Tax=Deinococcus reticulitermitis TaxID=856736 RepID=A0A1H6SW57_9DEIO|nr:hypothetical protein [Deinococcus reticulitermitis]SEI72189.1 hypothetical protein SAMN04488058_101437 [Deinococcus reticulitermitis]